MSFLHFFSLENLKAWYQKLLSIWWGFSCYVTTWLRASYGETVSVLAQVSLPLLRKPSMPSWGPILMTSSNPSYFPKDPLSSTINVWIGALSCQHMNFGGIYLNHSNSLLPDMCSVEDGMACSPKIHAGSLWPGKSLGQWSVSISVQFTAFSSSEIPLLGSQLRHLSMSCPATFPWGEGSAA